MAKITKAKAKKKPVRTLKLAPGGAAKSKSRVNEAGNYPVSGRREKPRCLQQLIKKQVEVTSREVEHVFVLLVFIGIGEEKKLESNDLFFRDLNDCVWYAQTLHKQGNLVTAYCLPRYVNPGNVRIY